MESALPCTELEFASYIGPIFPSGGLSTGQAIEDFWEGVEGWVHDNFSDAFWHSTVGESLVPTIGSPSAMIGQIESIVNTAYPGLNCWAMPVQEGG